MGCLGTEIAAHLGLNPDLLYRKIKEKYKIGFGEYLQQKKASGRTILREAQFEKAIKGDTAMLIFLGKQRLGQSEKSEIKSQNTHHIPQFTWDEGTEAEKDG